MYMYLGKKCINDEFFPSDICQNIPYGPTFEQFDKSTDKKPHEYYAIILVEAFINQTTLDNVCV